MNLEAARKAELSGFLTHWHVLEDRIKELIVHAEVNLESHLKNALKAEQLHIVNDWIARKEAFKRILLEVEALKEELEEGIEKELGE